MCLYTIKIKNKRFLPTIKNRWKPPVCTDERLRYIEVECGFCYECKKKRARQWSIRMCEELKENPHAVFFTGTFSPARIKKLCKKYGIQEEDANEIATKEVRLFLERIRIENNGKSVKHWIVTEKGHTNTRRIHIHGIFFHENKWKLIQLLKNNWIAGYCYNGKYVNEKTINYVVKYITKTDLDNKDFNAKILASPGLGKKFLKSIDAKKMKYFPRTETEKTREYYRFKNGQKAPLPRYYKEKIFTEDERQLLWIEKQEEGYGYVMGEKINLLEDGGVERYKKLKEFYRDLCVNVHKDNPEDWKKIKIKNRELKNWKILHPTKQMLKYYEKRNAIWNEVCEKRSKMLGKKTEKIKKKQKAQEDLDRDLEKYARYLEENFKHAG